MNDVTRILNSIQHGDPKAADELLPLVYGELRKLAAARMAQESPGQTLQPTALVGFNIGVELGQLAIVAVFLPWAFGLRRTSFYQTTIFKYGSALVILIATVWMAERIFGLTI